MSLTELDAELDVWQPAGCAIRIEYSRGVMDELRLAATDGFNRLAHGGVEIGGVLFGVRDADAVKILAQRALACEYAFGPSFTLSEKDRRLLEELRMAAQTDRELSRMQAVGWYHSHTRSEILLSKNDLELFEAYFPEIWQIALVLRPHRIDPVRAGFFFREPDGSIHAESPREEFILKPAGGKPLPGAAPADVTAPPSQIALLETRPQPLRESESPRNELVMSPSRPRRIVPNHHKRRWAWSAAAVLLIFAAAMVWFGRSRAPAGLSLRMTDIGGQLRIDWNHNSRFIQQSESGALEIEDGPIKMHNELSREHLLAGSVTYLRTSGNVLVRLLVRGADRTALTEMSRFLGPPIARAAPVSAGAADRGVDNRKSRAAPVVERASVERASVERATAERATLERGSGRAAKKGRVERERNRQTPPAPVPAPVRRLLILPATGVSSRAVEPSLPAPPLIAPNAAAAVPAFIPRLSELPSPPAPTPPAGASSAPSRADQGPAAGKIVWTGKLSRNGAIQILGNRALQGSITGALPGTPVRLEIFPSELTNDGLRMYTADPKLVKAPEAPGAQNGWNRTVYVLNPKKAAGISILEAPGQRNAWNRLVLRAERGDCSIIVIRWERIALPPVLPSALH